MQIAPDSISVHREITPDNKAILVSIEITLTANPDVASRLARILSTNVLEIQDAEWKAIQSA